MIATVSGSTTQFTDPNASAAANYAYSVEAVDATGNSSPIASPTTVGRPTDTIFSDDFETGDFSRWTSFFKATQMLKLDVEQIVPIHGKPIPWANFAKVAGAR